MKELFDQIKSITDIFNAGRVIFYPFAGALVVFPLYMVLRFSLAVPAETLALQMKMDLKAITTASSPLWVILLMSSMVVGFLIASMAFSLVLERRSGEIAAEVAVESADRSSSFTFNYPLLRQKKDEDYSAWLISEYYRYVEIATYIPLGGIIGLLLIQLYVFIFLLHDFARTSSAGFTEAHAVFLLLLLLLIFIGAYLWPQVWVKRVVTPAVRTYLRAKRNLIDGVKAVQRAVDPIKP